LEDETRGDLMIIRLNIQEEVGRELASVYGFQFTPTFIYFDAGGIELWRQVGDLDTQLVLESLK
jgi:hypothetical protein